MDLVKIFQLRYASLNGKMVFFLGFFFFSVLFINRKIPNINMV